MEDRRKFKRSEKTFSIFYHIYKRTEFTGDISRIKNISEVGLCIKIDEKLTEGDILELIFRLPPDFNKKIKLFGRIVGLRQSRDSLGHEASVSFIDVDNQTKEFIRSIIVAVDMGQGGTA